MSLSSASQSEVERAKAELKRLDQEILDLKAKRYKVLSRIYELNASRIVRIVALFDAAPDVQSFLAPQDLVNCLQTCKAWRQAISQRDDTYDAFFQWKCPGLANRLNINMNKERFDRIIRSARTKYQNALL